MTRTITPLRSKALLLVLLLATPLVAREVAVRPAPPWVEKLDVATDVALGKRSARWGLYDLLNDHQVRVADDAESQYFRTVRKVLSPSGVQNASELELDFDPSFERLTIHEVAVVRDGVRISAFDPASVRVIEKEEDSDRRIYDGERTALIFVKDVRPGDVIDYSWSLEGANPILAGRYTAELDLSSGVPSARMRHRLLWPADRQLRWRGGKPAITTLGNTQQLVWERRDVAPFSVDDEIPTWFEPWESVQVTEFASWNEVANWADAMFQLDERSSIEVKNLAAHITAENASRDARITAAIRFVQDEIRYLGIEMGRNSHEPHQPWETLEARWGDCKDKTLLLVALLRELGVEAYPALVSTRLQHRLEAKLPSPFLFDHVIAQVLDGGKTYWIDGTISDQGGTLATIETPGDGRALIVRAETTRLANIVASSRGMSLVEQTYTTTDYAKPTELEVKTTFSGAEADAMRSALSTLAVEDYAAQRINELAVDQPKIEAVGLPRIADDRQRNVLVVTERYRIRELWQDGSWTWYPRVLESHLVRPDTMIRSMPLAVDFPLDIEQRVTFHLPEALDIEKRTSVTETPALRYENIIDSSGKSVWIRQSLRARRDHVAAKDVAEHLTQLNVIWNGTGYRLVPPGARPKAASAMPAYKWVIGFPMLAFFVIACVLAARRKPRVVATPAFQPGEAPVSALPLQELDRHVAGMIACACGAALRTAPEFQRARYAEREMTIVTRQCGTCGREKNLYFAA
jgi:transglutaminase-like putative cysteine protease